MLEAGELLTDGFSDEFCVGFEHAVRSPIATIPTEACFIIALRLSLKNLALKIERFIVNQWSEIVNNFILNSLLDWRVKSLLCRYLQLSLPHRRAPKNKISMKACAESRRQMALAMA